MARRNADRRRQPAAGRTIAISLPQAGAAALLVSVVALAAFGLRGQSRGQPGAAPGPPTSAALNQSTPATAAPPPGHEAGTGVSPEGDPFIGSPMAPVTVVEYSDYLCPNCRQFATEVLPWLKQVWIPRGLVKVVYRDFAIRGEVSVRAAEAARCAGEQGRYWRFHDALFTDQPSAATAFEPAGLVELARKSSLDPAVFTACLESGRYRAMVDAQTQAALAKGFSGTPTFEINGQKTEGAIPIDRWNELFLAYQGQQSPSGVGEPTKSDSSG